MSESAADLIGPEDVASVAGAVCARDGAGLLRAALLDSRQRWQDLVAMAADFAFETDAAGRLVFLWPEVVLGWPAGALLGQPASLLLAASADSMDPFAIAPAFRDRRVHLKQADGGMACLSFSAAPLMQGGSPCGMRGVAQNVTEADFREDQAAAALRRLQVLQHILRQMRQEVLAPRMMQSVLQGLTAALGCSGAVVVNLIESPDLSSVLHHVGAQAAPVLPTLFECLQAETPDPVSATAEGDVPVLACPSYTRFGERNGLCVWRPAGSLPWTEDDSALVSSVSAIVRVVLEHEAIQRELARQARTDPLTGLLNRRSFLEEVHRRIDRLNREALPGTLMYIDLDNFKRLNDCCGHETGDEALLIAAGLLRNLVRPSDLVARLGGDEFALWLDGSDELTAAERAERLRLDAPAAFARSMPPGAPPLSTSIGIASRNPHISESLEEVMRRADQAMYEVKRAGRGHWRVSRDPLLP